MCVWDAAEVYRQVRDAIDERIRAALPNFATFRELEQEVRRLSDRLEALERRLADREAGAGSPDTGPRE